MGLVITGSIETRDGGVYDSMYVRIENLILKKYYGTMSCVVNYYYDMEAAHRAFPKYHGDTSNNPDGILNVSMSWDGGPWEEKNVLYQYPLTRTEFVNDTIYSSSQHMEVVQYIDFDDDGNEVVKEQKEMVEKVTEIPNGFERSVFDMSIIGGDAYGYGYTRLKETLEETFGQGNVNDSI